MLNRLFVIQRCMNICRPVNDNQYYCIEICKKNERCKYFSKPFNSYSTLNQVLFNNITNDIYKKPKSRTRAKENSIQNVIIISQKFVYLNVFSKKCSNACKYSCVTISMSTQYKKRYDTEELIYQTG